MPTSVMISSIEVAESITLREHRQFGDLENARARVDPGRLLQHVCTKSPVLVLNLSRTRSGYSQIAGPPRKIQCDAVYHGMASRPARFPYLAPHSRWRRAHMSLIDDKDCPMANHRSHLPQLSDRLFLTDAGMETFLIFHEGMELPYFASFDLMKDEAGTEQVRRYYERFIALARNRGLGFVLESPTWRANPDWAAKLGYDKDTLARINRRTIAVMAQLRDQYETAHTPIVISANIGPRGAGYSPGRIMRAE